MKPDPAEQNKHHRTSTDNMTTANTAQYPNHFNSTSSASSGTASIFSHHQNSIGSSVGSREAAFNQLRSLSYNMNPSYPVALPVSQPSASYQANPNFFSPAFDDSYKETSEQQQQPQHLGDFENWNSSVMFQPYYPGYAPTDAPGVPWEMGTSNMIQHQHQMMALYNYPPGAGVTAMPFAFRGSNGSINGLQTPVFNTNHTAANTDSQGQSITHLTDAGLSSDRDGNKRKRPRRKFHEVERIYSCKFPDCNKAYGTLNHLNSHVLLQNHGEKRMPEEFKELRTMRRQEKKRRKHEMKRRTAEAKNVQRASNGAYNESRTINASSNVSSFPEYTAVQCTPEFLSPSSLATTSPANDVQQVYPHSTKVLSAASNIRTPADYTDDPPTMEGSIAASKVPASVLSQPSSVEKHLKE